MSTIDTLIVVVIALMAVGLLGTPLVCDKDMHRHHRLLVLLVIIAFSVSVGGLSNGSKDHVVVSEPLVPVDTLILTRRAIDTIPDTVFIYKIRNNERKRSDQVDGHLHREDEGHMFSQGR